MRVVDPSGQGQWVWGTIPARETFISTHVLTMPATLGQARVEVAVYDLASGERARFVPGWLRSKTDVLLLSEIAVSGRPPAAPGTYNFDDRILLADVELKQTSLAPGGALELRVEWGCLQAMDVDYTLFVQFIAPDGTMKGQIDVWPHNGTHPTGAWQVGETVDDAYTVILNADAPPGAYRVALGWYLLETMQRLPVLDAEGREIADHVLIGGVQVSE